MLPIIKFYMLIALSPVHTSAPTQRETQKHGHGQTNVDPDAWFASAPRSDRRHVAVSTSEMDIDMDYTEPTVPDEPSRRVANLQDSQWATPQDVPSQTGPVSTPSMTTPAPFTNSESLQPVATLKDSQWAAPSFNVAKNEAAPYRSAQNEWPSNQPSVAGPTLTQAASHYVPTANPLHRPPNPLHRSSVSTPTQAAVTSHFGINANPFNHTSAPVQAQALALSNTGNPLNQASAPAPATAQSNNPTPAAKVEKAVRYLKDSMWAF